MRSTLLVFLVLAGLTGFTGCDGTANDGEATDVGADGGGRADVKTSSDSQGGYTPAGVTLDLGPNPCQDAAKHPECSGMFGTIPNRCGWDVATGKCFKANSICDDKAACTPGTYPAGSLLYWVTPAAQYLGNPTGGFVCVPTIQTYTINSANVSANPVCSKW